MLSSQSSPSVAFTNARVACTSAWYYDELYDELVRLANLRPARGPRVDKLARNLR